MIRSVGEFHGRKVEVRQILSRIGAGTPQSISLVGERRMGKSSVLWHISQREVYANFLEDPDRYLFVLIDFQRYGHLDLNGFCNALSEHLNEVAGDRLALPEGQGLSFLQDVAEAVVRADLRLVWLFDEFETITANPAFGVEFYNTLRSLANTCPVAYVTASRLSLQSLCHSREISGSPFFNIFTEIRVGRMKDEEIQELICGPSEAAGVPLEPHSQLIRDLGDNLAFFAQMACAVAFDDLADSADGVLNPTAVEASFLSEARSHFHYLWERFSDGERRVLAAIASGNDPDPADADWVKSLVLQGLLVDSPKSKTRLFSTALTPFLRETEPEQMETEVPAPHAQSVTRPGRSPTRAILVGLALAVLLTITVLTWDHFGGDESPVSAGDQTATAQLSTLRISNLQVQDLFASFYRAYVDQPIGSVTVVNDEADSVRVKLSFSIPGRTRWQTDHSLLLEPHSSKTVDLTVQLHHEILDLKGAEQVQARVELSTVGEDAPRSQMESRGITIYGRGALTWDSVGRAAAFVTPTDEAVENFARPVLVAFEKEIGTLGRPGRNLMRAMVLFEALKQHGVRYFPDSNTPYAKVSADRSAVDHIKYPAEVLRKKAGDCDDLTALYCALLEHAGVRSALVDYPGHIFALFDSGISRREAHKLPVGEQLTMLRGDRLWIPVEITLLDKSFREAWLAGARELAKLSAADRRRLVLDTAESWVLFPPAEPVFVEGQIGGPGRAALQEVVSTQYAHVEQIVEEHIDATYLDPLKDTPDNERLWLELSQVYVSLGRFEDAIKSAYTRLMDLGGRHGSTFNQLGIASFLKGDVEQAGYYFKQATDLEPQSRGFQRNLDRAMVAMGRAERAEGAVSESSGADELKSDAAVLDERDFYWAR